MAGLGTGFETSLFLVLAGQWELELKGQCLILLLLPGMVLRLKTYNVAVFWSCWLDVMGCLLVGGTGIRRGKSQYAKSCQLQDRQTDIDIIWYAYLLKVLTFT